MNADFEFARPVSVVAYVRDNLLLSNSSVSDLLGDSGENLLNKAFRSAKGTSFLSPSFLPTSSTLIANSHLVDDHLPAGYLDLFTELLLNLTDPSSTSTPNTSSRLNPLKTTSDQDRQVTKDGFTRFWDTLEGIEGVHRMNKLADSGEVKDRLRGEVKEKVGGGYKKAVIKWGGSLGPKCESLSLGAGRTVPRQEYQSADWTHVCDPPLRAPIRHPLHTRRPRTSHRCHLQLEEAFLQPLPLGSAPQACSSPSAVARSATLHTRHRPRPVRTYVPRPFTLHAYTQCICHQSI